jgi:ribokinase
MHRHAPVTGSGYDVVVVGSANRDYVCRVPRLPAPGETVLGADVAVGSGGKGGNQAVAAASFGARTAMVGCVGMDSDGTALLEEMVEAGVDVSAVTVLRAARTGAAFVFVAPDGENSIVVSAGANSRLSSQMVEEALGGVGRAAAVVTQGEVQPAALMAAVSGAGRLSARPILNLAPFVALPDDVLALADPLVVNAGEAAALLGRPVRGVASVRAAAVELLARATSVVVTAGANGAVVADRRGVAHVAAPSTVVVDSTGAGDAFTGALAAALSRGKDLQTATRWGVSAGAFAVSRPGAQASYPRGEDVVALLRAIEAR